MLIITKKYWTKLNNWQDKFTNMSTNNRAIALYICRDNNVATIH